MNVRTLTAVVAGVVALVIVLLVHAGPWAVVAIPAAVAGLVLRTRV